MADSFWGSNLINMEPERTAKTMPIGSPSLSTNTEGVPGFPNLVKHTFPDGKYQIVPIDESRESLAQAYSYTPGGTYVPNPQTYAAVDRMIQLNAENPSGGLMAQIDNRALSPWDTTRGNFNDTAKGVAATAGMFGAGMLAGGALGGLGAAGGGGVSAGELGAAGIGMDTLGTGGLTYGAMGAGGAAELAGGAGGAAGLGAVGGGALGAGAAGAVAPSLMNGLAPAATSGLSDAAYAALGLGALQTGVGLWSADKSADSIKDAAKQSADVQKYIFDRNTELNQPFYDVGKNALPGLAGWDANNPLPSYQQTVLDPMNAWKYEQSPAYKAQYALGSQELNRQLQARGLGASGIGASRAADLSRKLTAADYGNERAYQLGNYQDLYKSKYSENADRYNRLLDQVKVGTGASQQMGQAGNQYAQGIGQSAMAAGQANADFYSGLGGLIPMTVNTGLRTYDYGNRAGWWGNGNQLMSNNQTQQSPYDPYKSGGVF